MSLNKKIIRTLDQRNKASLNLSPSLWIKAKFLTSWKTKRKGKYWTGPINKLNKPMTYFQTAQPAKNLKQEAFKCSKISISKFKPKAKRPLNHLHPVAYRRISWSIWRRNKDPCRPFHKRKSTCQEKDSGKDPTKRKIQYNK